MNEDPVRRLLRLAVELDYGIGFTAHEDDGKNFWHVEYLTARGGGDLSYGDSLDEAAGHALSELEELAARRSEYRLERRNGAPIPPQPGDPL